jgi:hypothetical protein
MDVMYRDIGVIVRVTGSDGAEIRTAGATIRLDTEVERVIVEKGAVQGVRLRGGDVVSAPLVATSLGNGADLTGRETLAPAERSELARFENASTNLLGSYAACLSRAPEYKSGAHNPDINKCAVAEAGQSSTPKR